MSTRFRSYEAARKIFSVLEFISWAVCIIGAITFVIGLTRLGSVSTDPFRGGPSPISVYGLIFSGIFMGFSGLLGAAMAQFYRAGVDTAEYTQQMLKVNRNQLEVSRQALEQNATPQSFADVVDKSDTKPRGGKS